MSRPTASRAVLIILDGFGIGKDSPFNAISNAKMPFYQELVKKYPHSKLITHGEDVGLPFGVMGNSEVGHMTMGAGRIIYQDLTRISKEIREKKFHLNPVLRATIESGMATTGRVHLLGLLSDGGVHSHIDHLLALLDLCVEMRVPQVAVHPFLDGRDTPPNSATGFMRTLMNHPAFARSGTGIGTGSTEARIVTAGGRYFGMDRDKRWDRVQKAYDAMTGQSEAVLLPGLSREQAVLQVIEASHSAGKTDEFVEPVLLEPTWAMQDGDSAIFFNYRSDRARELSEALTRPGFTGFTRAKWPQLSQYAGMAVYDKTLGIPAAYLPQNSEHIFGEWLEERHLTQLRIAETEKYAHVTFFFNAGREAPFKGEDRILIPSPRDVPTYDLKPEMSAFQVAEEAAKKLLAAQHDFVVMNFANADMVGHTGNYEAAIRAVEALDQCLAKVIGAAEKSGYHVLLTADHGNAEEMQDCNGHLHTQHTLNPVPAIWIEPNSAIAPRSSRKQLRDGTLADVMPTLCDMMGLPLPKEVTGKSLIPSP